MDHNFRNPFTPSESDEITPQRYLEVCLNAAVWDRKNPVKHLHTCKHESRRTVFNAGFCCVQHLKQCIEGTLIDLAGCRAGVFVEPEGFRKWLNLARVRLAELEKGKDFLQNWTTVLDINGPELNGWIWVADEDTSPVLSLKRYIVACQEYGFTPNFKELAFAFYATEKEVSDCWANPI